MNTKYKLLQLFESNKGQYFSGEEIAKKLNVSRAAVWKAVKSLRGEGYDIDAVTNRGYCLSETTDILSPQGICKYLSKDNSQMDITVLSTVNSTNLYVKEKAMAGFGEGYMVFANEQTNGKGRYGRDFFSPGGTGIYMSLLLRPQNYTSKQAVRITTMAALAMCETIEKLSDKNPLIKWVNDIYLDDRKICGILTEGSFDLESNTLEYAVLGVGLNVYKPEEGFPDELSDIMGALFDRTENDIKNRLSADFINRFMKYYRDDKNDYIEGYKRRSLILGKKVTVMGKEGNKEALAVDIDNECRLIVRYEDGVEETLSSGEIGIKIN